MTMDYKDVLENAERTLFEGLSAINDYPNDDVEMELLEIQQNILDEKLQVVREALLVFTRGFSTSRPLLLKMHELYSSAVKVRNERLEEYIELTRSLLDVKHIRMDPMAYFQRKCKEKWEALVKEKMNLIYTVSSLKNALQEEQLKMNQLKIELENNEAQIKIEYQARLSALLEVKDIQNRMNTQIKKRNALSPQVLSSVHPEPEHDPSVTDCDYAKRANFSMPSKDPIFLEDKIQTCQKVYTELSKEMCDLKVMYSDSVPLKRYEALEEVVSALEKRKSELEDIIGTMKEENHKISEENSNLRKKNNETLKKLNEMESGSSMIAAQWNRCAEFIPGGIERWKKLSKGKDNGEKLEILVNEFEIMSIASKYYEDNVLFT